MQSVLTQKMNRRNPEAARQCTVGFASAPRVKYGQCVLRYFLDLDIKHKINFKIRLPHYMDKVNLNPFFVLL